MNRQWIDRTSPGLNNNPAISPFKQAISMQSEPLYAAFYGPSAIVNITYETAHDYILYNKYKYKVWDC